MSGTLVLVRHGQSEWNLKNLFTGWRDPDLTELGVEEAKTGGKALAVQADVSDFESVKAMVAKTAEIGRRLTTSEKP